LLEKKESLSQGKKRIVEKPLSCYNVDVADVKACRKCEKMFIKNVCLLEKRITVTGKEKDYRESLSCSTVHIAEVEACS
jgi:hypothetical protein